MYFILWKYIEIIIMNHPCNLDTWDRSRYAVQWSTCMAGLAMSSRWIVFYSTQYFNSFGIYSTKLHKFIRVCKYTTLAQKISLLQKSVEWNLPAAQERLTG